MITRISSYKMSTPPFTWSQENRNFYVEPSKCGYNVCGGGTMWVHFDPNKKKNPLRSDSEWVAGGDSRSRTDDPLLAKQVL